MDDRHVTIHDMYDQHTSLIMRLMLSPNSSCIDVGAHVGALLTEMVRQCPNGNHVAFEPIPHLFEALQARFPDVKVYPFACSDERGASPFFFVENDPAYSGLRRRTYDRPDPKVSEITVARALIDDVISPAQKIDFIKIDVEGAELKVLRGAKRVIIENRPLIVFESGIGASDYYGTTGEMLFDFLVGECGLEINTLDGFLCGRSGLTRSRVGEVFNTTSRYYFVAARRLAEDERVSIRDNYLLDLDMRVWALENRETFRAPTAYPHDTVPAPEVDHRANLDVESWGPQSMLLGSIPNRQPDGSLGIWIRVSGVRGMGDLCVFFDGQPMNTTVREGLITIGVPPSLLSKPGTKPVIIEELPTGKTFTVGAFSINRPKGQGGAQRGVQWGG